MKRVMYIAVSVLLSAAMSSCSKNALDASASGSCDEIVSCEPYVAGLSAVFGSQTYKSSGISGTSAVPAMGASGDDGIFLVEDMIVPDTGATNATTKLGFGKHVSDGVVQYLFTRWRETDKLMVCLDSLGKNPSYVFSLCDGASTASARFRSNEEVKYRGKKWFFYFPSSITTEAKFRNKSFKNQSQGGDNNCGHLANYFTMRKIYRYSDFTSCPGEVEFSGNDFASSGCICFTLKNLPDAITADSLKIEIYSLSAIHYTTYSNFMKTTVYSQAMAFTSMPKQNSLTAFMGIPVGDIPLEGTLRVTVKDTDGIEYYTERDFDESAVLPSGKLSRITLSKRWVKSDGLDGSFAFLQKASAVSSSTTGCNVVIMGDGYTYADYQGSPSKFEGDLQRAYAALFDIEPLKGLKPYFNVAYINVVSGQVINVTSKKYTNGAENIDTFTPFEMKFTPNATTVSANYTRIMYAVQQSGALTSAQLRTSVVLVVGNCDCHAGSCSPLYSSKDNEYSKWYSIGMSSRGKTAEGFRRTVIHETCGHGFGKLADEYTSTTVVDDLEKAWADLANRQQNSATHRNVSKYQSGVTVVGDTPWATLAASGRYAVEGIGVYEGAYAKANGFCRSTEQSVMRGSTSDANIWFNAIGRYLIYMRAMRLCGKSAAYVEENFPAWDAAHLPDIGPYATSSKSGLMKASAAVPGEEGLLPGPEPDWRLVDPDVILIY